MKKTDPIKKVTLRDGRTRYRFVVDVGPKPDGRRDQRTFTCDTLKQARADRARIITETAGGTYVKPNRSLTVEDWFAEWLAGRDGSVKATTYRFYVDMLRPPRERLGHLRLQDLAERHLEGLIGDMRSGEARRRGAHGKPLSARSINGMLTVVGMALSVAVKRQMLARNVAETVSRDGRPAARRKAWEVADAVRFLKAVESDRLYAAWLLSLLGLRRGEVCGLRWCDVDFTAQVGGPYGAAQFGTLTVAENRLDVAGAEVVDTPKSEESERTLPLPKFVADALAKLQADQSARRADNAEVWATTNPADRAITREDGTPVPPSWYSDEFGRQAARAGVPAGTLHSARHTAASLMARLGIPMVVAAAWLGQSQLSITQHYQHAHWGGMLDASKRFQILLTEGPEPGQVASVTAITGAA